jgi:hypothetical protein
MYRPPRPPPFLSSNLSIKTTVPASQHWRDILSVLTNRILLNPHCNLKCSLFYSPIADASSRLVLFQFATSSTTRPKTCSEVFQSTTPLEQLQHGQAHICSQRCATRSS